MQVKEALAEGADIDVADSGSDSDNDADGHFHKRSNTCGGGDSD